MRESILLVVLSKTSVQTERSFEHLGVAYIAAYLRQHGYPVKIIDQNLTNLSLNALIEEVNACSPELIGIACYQDAYADLKSFVCAVKKANPAVHLSLGGVFATNSYLQIFQELPLLDSVVLGDGEETFLQLAEAILHKKDWTAIEHLTYPDDLLQFKKRPKYDTDLNLLPDPARDTLPLVLKQDLFPILSASRGCYGHCSYCSITIQNRQRRTREIGAVVDEMERLRKDFRTRYFYFIDDTFIGRTKEDSQRIEEFARTIANRKLDIQFSIECRANEVHPDLMKMLKEVGLFTVFLGIESGYQPTLDLFRKGVRVEQNLQAIQILTDLKIRYSIGFIMFHPYTSLAEVAANLEFLQNVEQKNFLDSLHRRLMVFHKAPISDRLLSDGISCDPWHRIQVPFLNPEIEPLFKFIERFTAELRPGINQLAVHYSQIDNEADKNRIAELHATLCSTYVNTVYEYTQTPAVELLDERLGFLQKEYYSLLDGLKLKF